MDDSPVKATALVLFAISLLLFTGGAFGYHCAENHYKDEFFKERIIEHACKVQEVQSLTEKTSGQTCLQPDGRIFSK